LDLYIVASHITQNDWPVYYVNTEVRD